MKESGIGRPGGKDEHGSLTVEAVILVPVFVLFVLVAVAFGRLEVARQEVNAAAQAAAEVAAVMPSPATAEAAGDAAATPALNGQTYTCAQITVQTDVHELVAGGDVQVSVTCRTTFADLLVPGFPGSVSVEGQQTAPIDPYRAVQ